MTTHTQSINVQSVWINRFEYSSVLIHMNTHKEKQKRETISCLVFRLWLCGSSHDASSKSLMMISDHMIEAWSPFRANIKCLEIEKRANHSGWNELNCAKTFARRKRFSPGPKQQKQHKKTILEMWIWYATDFNWNAMMR